MTARAQVGDREAQRWHPCLNGSGETIPAFAAMAVTNLHVEHTTCLDVEKPQPTLPIAFNGPAPIPVGGYGECTLDVPCAALLKAELAEAQFWYGPVSGQWYLSQKSLYRTFVEVAPTTAADSSGNHVGVVVRSAARTLFEMTQDLAEGGSVGSVATAYLLDEQGARTTHTATISPAPYETGSSLVGPFRGVAFAAESASSGFRGDVVEALYLNDQWIAVGSGRTAITGTVASAAAAGASVTVAVDTADSRTISASGTALCAIEAGARVKGHWNGPEQRWDVQPACPSGSEDPPPDPDDPEDPPDGGGGGPGDAACYPCNGMPPGVDCSPLNCCPEDDTGLAVTDCEEFATAPEEYYVEVPPLTCVPDCATGNEPDATTGLPAGRVVLTHVADTCRWESDEFDCGDGVTWQWKLTPSLDGRSWLRLHKDGTVFLQWQTADAWCPRCDNPVTIYCPPDECTDLTAKLCVKPVCTSCADAICYTVSGPTDWDGVSSASFTWQGDDANSGTAVTDNADGRPNPPSRKVTLVYGTVPANVDGAAVVETFPGIVFPAACGVDLDGVCGIELSVKVQSDDSVGDRGVKVGIAIKQGTDSFIATIGTVREGEGWKTFEVNRLLAADFDKVTATGLDDTTHPDWTLPATDMTFGVGLYAEDDETDDELGGPITVVANWDILRLCLDAEPCTGDPASYTCPEALSIAACQETGGTASETITLTNDGDSPFTVVVAVPSTELIACGFGGSTITYGQSPSFGPVAPGDDWTMTITVRLDTATTCSGTVTITTDLPGEAATCIVPVNVVVLATAACDPEEPCATFHFDDRNYFVNSGVSDGTPLTDLDPNIDFSPANGGLLAYVEAVAVDADGAQIDPAPDEFITGPGQAYNTSADLQAGTLIVQMLDGVPDNFAAKGVLFSSGGGSGLVFFYAAPDDWYAVIQSSLMGAPFPTFEGSGIYRQRPNEPLALIGTIGANNPSGTCFGLHVVGGRARIVRQDAAGVADGALLSRSDVDHDFDDVVCDNGGSGLGIVYWHRVTGTWNGNSAHGELCITDHPGLLPVWGVPA